MTNLQENGLHVLCKKLGETPLQCIHRFKKENSKFESLNMTYAGRLDPMAEGLLLVLSGEKLFQKEKYLNLPKTYIFEVLWEVETDTLDILGLISKSDTGIAKIPPLQDVLKDRLEKSKGVFEQVYPAYSSKPVLGPREGTQVAKPLFQWAREGRLDQVQIPKHKVEIFEGQFISRRSISAKDLLQDILSKISLVSGDFRQTEISEKWEEFLTENSAREFTFDTISLTVSSGFYVRQFVHDLAEKLGTFATTFHIKRTRVGDFHS